MSKATFQILLVFLLAVRIMVATAQRSAFRIEESNIAPSTIDCFFEDSQGFLWMGTYGGLYRYDGYRLEHFRYEHNNPYSISDNKVRTIEEDPKGNLWVGTQVGLNYFDVRTRRFQHFSDTAKCGLGKVFIYDLAFDKNGTLWVAAADGLHYLDAGRKRFVKKFPERQEDRARTYAVTSTRQGLYFAAGDRYYLLQDKKKPKVLAARDSTHYVSILQAADDTPSPDAPDGIVWLGAKSGLLYVDRRTQQVSEVEALRGAILYGMGKQGATWLACTDKGLYVVDARTRQAQGPITAALNGVPQRLNDVTRMLTASNGITWFFTTTGKLYKADLRKEQFRHAVINLADAMPGANKLCELFEYSPGVLLIPRDTGPALFNLHTGAVEPFRHRPTDNQDGWRKGITCFLDEPDSMLWIGTVGGLFLLDRKNGRFVPLERRFEGYARLRGVCIRKIHRDRKGNLWVAAWTDGLFKIDAKEQSIRQYNHTLDHQTNYMHHSRSILEARNGELWIGTRGGLFRYFEATDSFQVYRNDPNDRSSMSENTSFCLYEDADGNIWSGSYGGG